MARSAHAARLVAALSEGASCLVSARRGYSATAAPSAALRKVEEKAAASAKGKGKKMGAGVGEPPSAAASSWVPDPVTGYYRPANRMVDVDAAELRRRLLSRKPHH